MYKEKNGNTQITNTTDKGEVAGKVFKCIGIGVGVTCLIGVIATVALGWLFVQLVKVIAIGTAF